MSSDIRTGRLPAGSVSGNSLDERPDHQIEDQRRSALAEKDALAALTASKGWAMLCAWMQGQIQHRVDLVMLQPLTSTKEQLQQEFIKGECTAYRTLMEIVKTGLETSKAVVESLDEHRPDHGTTDSELQDD